MFFVLACRNLGDIPLFLIVRLSLFREPHAESANDEFSTITSRYVGPIPRGEPFRRNIRSTEPCSGALLLEEKPAGLSNWPKEYENVKVVNSAVEQSNAFRQTSYSRMAEEEAKEERVEGTTRSE